MRTKLIVALSVFTGFLSLASGASAVCVPSSTPTGCLNASDKSCSQLGQTTMDGDKKNIIACLEDNSGLVWKSMSLGDLTCSSGQAISNISGGTVGCININTSTSPSSSPTPPTSSPSSPTPPCTQTTKTVAVGGGNCTLFWCAKRNQMECGMKGDGSCPSSWSYWGTGKPGGCSSGTSSYGIGGTSFTCYQQQTVCQ